MWEQKMRRVFSDTYAGVGIEKLPEDLRTYEHLLWEAAPRVVLELGGFRGGSSLWFTDRLLTLERYGKVTDPYVVTVDQDGRHFKAPRQRLVVGDLRDVVDEVRALIPDGTDVMVIEDSAHTYETTRAALECYSDFVQPGGFFVVEDTVVDDETLRFPSWPRGVTRALEEWLPGKPFKVRDDFGEYGYSTNWGGLLQRV